MLSILIPSYNHAPFVVEAIASARSINVPGKRIIVIDDASPDRSAEVIAAYIDAEHAEDVEFIRKPQNKGAIDSVLTFLALCTTKYVYFMASDDVADPAGIKCLVDQMEANQSLQFVIGGGMNVLEDGRRTPLYSRKHDVLFSLSPEELYKALFLRDPSPLLCQSSVFRLDAIREVRGFDRDVVADDYALFAKLFGRYARRGVDFDFRPQINCVLYRHHGSNSYRNLVRQASSHRQVIHASAPSALCSRAAGYKLAYFILVAMRRLDLASATKIALLSRHQEIPWVVVGLFVNLQQWSVNRRCPNSSS